MPAKPLIPSKRKRRPGTSVLAIKDSKPGGDPHTGNEARLEAYVKRAVELKRLNYYHHEIAEMIAEEFMLESEPAVTTIADWLKKGSQAINKDIEEIQWQWRLEQFRELDTLKRKWMPLATANTLEIKRWKMVEGELQPVMDENAVAEQIDATNAVVKIMARQAKLLGLDLEKSIAPTGEGPANLQDLQIWLIAQMTTTAGAPNGKSIDIESEVLEDRTGIPEIDKDRQDSVNAV